MAMKLYSDSDIQDIADAIRSKNGSSDTYKVSQMATAISNIPSGGSKPALLNGKDVIYGSMSSLNTTPSQYTITTSSSLGCSGGYYSSAGTTYGLRSDITTSAIGGNITSYLKQYSFYSREGYFGGPPYGSSTSSMSSKTMFLSYEHASGSGEGTANSLKVATFDYTGTITGVFDGWGALATALENKEVNISNGLMAISSFVQGASQNYYVGKSYYITLSSAT